MKAHKYEIRYCDKCKKDTKQISKWESTEEYSMHLFKCQSCGTVDE